ncbi:MAG: HlyD family type I secretion periplasmic adaptor subunit [Alphaproteobacteria bacterium]|nr:HlyD family type I secretion periplasmic adaptor subunit [Alphaproteobacteria bacterium]
MTLRIAAPSERRSRPASNDNAKPYIVAGLLLVVLLLGGLFAWSATAKIDGAVVAPGTVVVESNRKPVQHLEGGVIGAVFVREGDAVDAGQVLIRLNDTIERANLAVVVDQLHALMARHARLRAEIDGADAIAFAAELLTLRDNANVRDTLDGQAELFRARRAARNGQHRIFEQQIANFRDQIDGLKAQRAARSRQMHLIRQELAGVGKLYKKGHAPVTRILELKRQLSRIEAQRAEHTTDIARATNSIGEVRLRQIQAGQDFRETVTTELRDVQARLQTLVERRVAAEARLARIEITAPQSGTVLALKAHAVGGVIQAGETILEIVPGDDELLVQTQVLPKDVDKVQVGQRSRIRLSALDLQVTPEIFGTLESVSADRLEDPRGGAGYFVTRIRIDDAELAKLGNLELVPGMPAEVFIQTGERLAISYLLKPLLESVTRAFKDG